MKTHTSQTKATHVAAFTLIYQSNIQSSRKAALLLFSVAVLLAGGAATVRGQSALDGFDPNANGTVRVVGRPTGRQDSHRRRFYNALAKRRSSVTRNRIARLNPDGTLDTSFDPNASADNGANVSLQSRCRRTARFWWAALQAASADRRAPASPGSMPRPDWLIRSTRTRALILVSCAINCGAGGRQDFSRRQVHQHRRTDAQLHRPARCHRPAWLIRSTRTRTMVYR